MPQAWSKVRLKKPSGRNPAAGPGEKNTVQQWLPLRDIAGGCLVLAGGSVVAVVRVEPSPFTLLSAGERARRIAALHEAIQALPGPAQVCAIPRPIDLDAYLAELEARLAETDGSRRAVLRGYARYVRGLVAGAAAMERRFYVLLPGDGRKKGGREETMQRAGELVAALARADLAAHLCGDQEILDLLFCFFHPAQAAFERAEFPAAAPLYLTAGEVGDHGPA